jgi:hypothetical protein
VSIEDDAKKDLALDPADAENVVGGMVVGVNKKKAKKAKHAAHKAAGHAGSNINIQGPTTPIESTGSQTYDGQDEASE